MSVCLSGYRLGSWTWHSYETGIIRTSMTWKCVTWIKFFPKSDQWSNYRRIKLCRNAFLWEKFVIYFFVYFERALKLLFYKIDGFELQYRYWCRNNLFPKNRLIKNKILRKKFLSLIFISLTFVFLIILNEAKYS